MKISKTISLFLAVTLIASLFAGCSSNNNDTGDNTPPSAASRNAEETTENTDTTVELSYEEGTSPADDIVNTTAADKVLLVVSFGTSFNQSRSLAIGGIEAAFKDAYPDYQIRRAFTSQIIIDKLAERENLQIDNVTEAMDRLVLDKVKEVIVQPTTLMNGYEYDDVIAEVTPFADKFESLKIGKQLLNDDSDYSDVADALIKETSAYRADGTAIVFMGHGTEHEADATYAKFQQALWDKGASDYLVATVEGELTIEEAIESLKKMNAEKVVLRPLMIVAGDHANNDMAGDEEDSWKTLLTEEGFTVETVLEGMGRATEIQQVLIRHAREAESSGNLSAEAETPAALAVGVSADRIKNGTYSIDVYSSTSMFKIVDCQLTVEDNSMTAVMTLSGQGFGKLYFGTGEQALADTEDNFYNYAENGERHSFTVPVPALDREMDCAGLSIRKEQWYDHIVVFESANIPNDAFIEREINVELTGGTGRASIQSPASLAYKDGSNYARLVWSSPNYIYMLADNVKYLPVNTEGNSVFEIPVVMDRDMKVTACTVAMSEPKEIEYTLRFDSSSIK